MQWVSLCNSTGTGIDLLFSSCSLIFNESMNNSHTRTLHKLFSYRHFVFLPFFVEKMDELIEHWDDQNLYNTIICTRVCEFSGNWSMGRLKFTAEKPLCNNCFSSTHLTFIYHREYQRDNDITNREAMPGVNTPV